MSDEPIKKQGTSDVINGSFTLSESPEEKLKGEFIVSKSVNKIDFFSKYITLSRMLKIIPIFAMYAGVYGFTYQKGMVSEMGLENVDFNYEIKEIYFFTLLGINQIAKNFTEISFIPDVNQIVSMAGIFCFCGVVIHFSIFKKDLVKKNIKKIKYLKFPLFRKVIESFWLSGVFGSLVGMFIALISQFFLKFAFAMVFVALLFPGFLGLFNGIGYIKELKAEERPCVIPEANKIYQSSTVFCPKLVIRGQNIWGKIVLSTNSGYFLRKNGYFAYISKNESVCAFSYYGTPVDEKIRDNNTDKKSLPIDPAIKNICYKKYMAK